MAQFTLTTWNAEWLEFTAGVDLGWIAPGKRTIDGPAPTKQEAAQRILGLVNVVNAIDPDILFLCEGIVGAQHMCDFVAKHLPAYDLVTHPGNLDKPYGVQGDQWLWFLVRKSLSDAASPALLELRTWQAYSGAELLMGHSAGSWMVSVPEIKNGEVRANIRKKHSHYRHPQTLVLNWRGTRVEVIGLHLKSKLVTSKPRKRAPAEDFETYARLPPVAAYLAELTLARIKLTTEATDVRYYIDHRFAQEPDPTVFVVGDLNDGPGKELLEREYLFHDLVSNLQGDVFFASRFLNHALFDFPGDLRWTAKFTDFLDPARSSDILLDHIMFTQAATRSGSGPLLVPAGGGRVEHEIYERFQSLQPAGAAISDHRPVSVTIKER